MTNLTTELNSTKALLNSTRDQLSQLTMNESADTARLQAMIESLNTSLNENITALQAAMAENDTILTDQLLSNMLDINGQLSLLNSTLNDRISALLQYNDSLIWDKLNTLNQSLTNATYINQTVINQTLVNQTLVNQTYLNGTLINQTLVNQTVTKVVKEFVDDPNARMLGVGGIIMGFAGMGIAALALRRRRKDGMPPETGPPEAETAGTSAAAVSGQAAPLLKGEPGPLPPIMAPEEQTPTTIEDVFLLYNDGRLLSHQTRRLKPGVDDAILGGMLTAVQSFIQESFSGDDDEAIKTLEYGSMKIIIERHEKVYLATVMSGDEPRNLRKDMRHLLMDIWDSHRELLVKWDGDTNRLKKINGMMKQFIKGT